ncbi:brain-specific angiogenesis inhibitor 1-associated protein 2-like protein 2 [Rhineura floridana]|uniref:brain-specific angiogenesis inhibitor 1-associated protein 2-like protein 2 n=1 Tax=Rhineura floridana TaxID=261503 RepID=UPI002AC85B9C|nr:brain-specific angiogenesis inhibitor 1-associated protein 2-like protein 2 [Rhineura floridana]
MSVNLAIEDFVVVPSPDPINVSVPGEEYLGPHKVLQAMEQSYRSTISIYKNILEQFNPALENLVYLGNKYLRAFHVLAEAADVYFTAIQKIGEQALQSSTSQILGEILIQMSDTQIHLNRNLEVVAQTFHVDLLQHVEKNTKMDMQFINESRQRYEKEYRRRAANIDKCISDLWRMERTRDKNTREMKENMMHLHTEMQDFVNESQKAAEMEEKRRYRFLAEKHQLFSNTFLQFYTRARTIIQNKAPLWKEQLEATRNPAQTFLNITPNHGASSGSLVPSPVLELPQRPLGDFSSVTAGRSSSPFPQETAEMLPSPQSEPRRRTLKRTPSIGSLSTGQRSRSSSFGEQAARRAEAGGKEGNSNSMLKVQAIAPHLTGSNQTLLQFSLGDVVTVLIPEAQNGWLYGKLEGTSMSGWFPEAFVKPLVEVRGAEEITPRMFPLRSSHSVNDLLDQPSSTPSAGNYWHSSSRPQSPSPSPAMLGAGSRRSSTANAAAPSDSKKPAGWEHPPELFPRGTNPFATVKLRPTVTNDRSAPIIQ